MATTGTASGEPAPLRSVALAGASGFLGTALAAHLQAEGVIVRRLRRGSRTVSPDITWDPAQGTIDSAALEGVDAIVNLAGEPVAQRWTGQRKAAIRDSRIRATSLLANTIARLRERPRTFLSGSATGIYGDRGDEELDERSALGVDFLAETAIAWERSAQPAASAGVRVALLRTGIVLNPSGGALAKMLLPFKFGLGGRIGSGAQWMSWIGLSDWVRAASFLLNADTVEGPVNLVAPNAMPNVEFTKALARVLGRPTLGFVPATAVDLFFGEMGRATLLASQRVRPRRLVDAGFEFTHPTLERALRAELAAPH